MKVSSIRSKLTREDREELQQVFNMCWISQHSLYKVLSNMRERCYSVDRLDFKRYGGRGIIICEEWLNNPTTFFRWALNNGYKKDLEIDRTNNEGNYEPGNCRFVTRKVNCQNQCPQQTYKGSRVTSKYHGVTWSKFNTKWMVQIHVLGERKYLGYFKSEKLAALRWDVEAFLIDNRNRNFIENVLN